MAADTNPGTPGQPYEIKLEADGPVDWSKALEDLNAWDEKTPAKAQAPAAAPAPAAPPAAEEAGNPAPAATPPPAPEREKRLSRYEELCKKPSMIVKDEDAATMDELSEILSSVNSALNQLKKFEKKHPYLIAPNVFRHWEDSLKETATIMYREFHNMRNGKEKKVYDKKYVCLRCKSVFMMPLPMGICDECRSSRSGGGGEY